MQNKDIEFISHYNSSREILLTNMKFYRKQHSFSQNRLSERSGLQRSYLAELESGKRNPTISKIYQIADGFRMEPWRLMKPISLNEWNYGKENNFTSIDLSFCNSKAAAEKEHLKTLIHHIKFLRKKKNWVQQELAEASGLSEIFIRHIELGLKQPTLDSMDKLSFALGLEVWELVKGINMNQLWIENKMWM